MSELIRYDAMCTAIAACHAVDEVKEIRDKAIALEAYARQALDTDSERKALEIRLRAERRCGQLLAEKERDPTAGLKQGPSVQREPTEKSEYQQAKEQAGISDTQAKRWQGLAKVPDDAFEDALADPLVKPTTTGLLPKKETPKATVQDEAALWVWGRLRDFEINQTLTTDPVDVFSKMTRAMRADVIRLAPAVSAWLNQLGGQHETTESE